MITFASALIDINFRTVSNVHISIDKTNISDQWETVLLTVAQPRNEGQKWFPILRLLPRIRPLNRICNNFYDYFMYRNHTVTLISCPLYWSYGCDMSNLCHNETTISAAKRSECWKTGIIENVVNMKRISHLHVFFKANVTW